MISPLWDNIFKKRSDESETVLALQGVPIFQELDKSEFVEIEKLVHQRTYTQNETIFSQGQPGLGMYIVLSGKVNIVRHDEEGNKLILASLSQGSFFGDMSLLNDAPRSATAEAAELSQIIAFFRPDLFDLLNRKPKTGIKIITGVANVIATRLRAQNELTQELQEQVDSLQKELNELKSTQQSAESP
ncbi:MAG: cyclic nucleotide-binding domain-containing protein [Candidatus Marinimicrobia bacterium]|nr:cyclic nucleotide-binding domain-containing protein [Candidatus Neomarinimicrobiota bacterium]MCF7830129.1 cyclic nucleotide-binding domain-containing protein [Candidatus Neomarinimicrobiota bacterium]MCF7882206.1 cyclic nucleotide-binding domain-containing protein [Candidatus Neomarinimicrobiota bacterium]